MTKSRFSNNPSIIFFIMAGLLCFSNPAWAGQTQDKPIRHRAGSIDPALATSVTAAMFGHKEKKMMLVDVRPAADFRKYHIPGSLNIALHAVRTKAFLKSKPVVLVNEGYVVGPLARTCRTINARGFKAAILDGGLCAWKRRGGALTGDHFAQRGMQLISPQQFHQEHAFDHQMVVQFTGTPSDQGGTPVPGARQVALSNPTRALAQIKAWIKGHQSKPFFSMVLMTTTGEQDNRIQRLVAQAGLAGHGIFYLPGGRQAYETYLERTLLAQKSRKERTRRTNGCATCAQASTTEP